MPEPSTNSSLTLSDLFASVKKQWRPFVAIIALFGAAGIAVGVFFPQEYAATAALTVESLDVAQSSSAVNMETERVVASSTSVLMQAVKDAPGMSVPQLKSALAVSVPKGSQVLEFSVTLDDPESAAVAANAVASAYSALRVANAEESVATASETLTARITALETKKAAEGEDSKVGRAATIQIQALEASLATLNSTTFNPGTIVSPAIAPTDSTRPSLVVFGGGAFAFGLIVATFVAMYRARSKEAAAAATAAAAHADATKKEGTRPPHAHSAKNTKPAQVPVTKPAPKAKPRPAARKRPTSSSAPVSSTPAKPQPLTTASSGDAG